MVAGIAGVAGVAPRLRRCWSWLLLACLASTGMVCSDVAPARGVELVVEVLDAAGRAADRFSTGEPLRLRLMLTNRASAPIALAFSSAQTYDAVLIDEAGAEVWRWSRGRRFAQMLSELALAPDASRAFELSCDPGARGQPPLAPGRYRAVGIVPATSGALRSEPVAFRVEP